MYNFLFYNRGTHQICQVLKSINACSTIAVLPTHNHVDTGLSNIMIYKSNSFAHLSSIHRRAIVYSLLKRFKRFYRFKRSPYNDFRQTRRWSIGFSVQNGGVFRIFAARCTHVLRASSFFVLFICTVDSMVRLFCKSHRQVWVKYTQV